MEDLKKITDGMKEEGLRSKMEDILLVMENFEDYIKERYLISEQLLDVLAQKVERSEKLKNATFYLVWIYRIYADPEEKYWKSY